jgi:hypothetical protein
VGCFLTKILGWLWSGFKTESTTIHAKGIDIRVFMRRNEIDELSTEATRV